MRRLSKTPSTKLSPYSQRLIALSTATVHAGSRLERRVWDKSLDESVLKLLKTGRQGGIDAALEHLFKTDLTAYDALLESTEAMSESSILEHDGKEYDVLLVAAPILAWTRFSITSGPLEPDVVKTLTGLLSSHVLCPDARVTMAPALFSIDQLPFSHIETFGLTKRLSQAAISGAEYHMPANRPETIPFLADVRYLVAGVAVPAGSPIFRWQSMEDSSGSSAAKDECLAEWQKQAMPSLTRLLPGCNIELMLPEAFFSACRKADQRIRPASIRAATNYLTNTLDIQPSDLCVVIGGFGSAVENDFVEEYRVSFMTQSEWHVLYGIVWPVYGPDEAQQTEIIVQPEKMLDTLSDQKQESPLEQILSVLKECGVDCEKIHSQRFLMEFCDDCGAPLYPDLAGDLVHAEMPEDIPKPGHFH